MEKLLDFLDQQKLYKRCFCDRTHQGLFFGHNIEDNIATLAYLFGLGAHFARRHDFPSSSHVSRCSDPVPHPRLGLRVNNLQKYIKLSMYGIFDESCEYKRRIISILPGYRMFAEFIWFTFEAAITAASSSLSLVFFLMSLMNSLRASLSTLPPLKHSLLLSIPSAKKSRISQESASSIVS